jgi:hypothetical protein
MEEPGKTRRKLKPNQIEVVDDVMAEILRKKTPAERLEIGFKLWTAARKMLTAHLTSINPDWNEEQISREVARRMSHGVV